jgi:hypothetical protein
LSCCHLSEDRQFSKNRRTQAEPLYKRSLIIREKALDPKRPHVATSLENIAVLYRKTNRDKEAQAFEKRAALIRAIQR